MTPEWILIVSCSLGLNVLLLLSLVWAIRLICRQLQTLRQVEQDLIRISFTSRTPSPR